MTQLAGCGNALDAAYRVARCATGELDNAACQRSVDRARQYRRPVAARRHCWGSGERFLPALGTRLAGLLAQGAI